MTDWIKPTDAQDEELEGLLKAGKLAPPADEIPEDFFDPENYWVVVFVDGLHQGFPRNTMFNPKDGVDVNQALRHLRAVVGSGLKYDEKEAVCAYLMSLWFEDIVIPPRR